MGFDAIDRQFRRKEILLECVECGKTDGVKARFQGDPAEAVLCEACYEGRTRFEASEFWGCLYRGAAWD